MIPWAYYIHLSINDVRRSEVEAYGDLRDTPPRGSEIGSDIRRYHSYRISPPGFTEGVRKLSDPTTGRTMLRNTWINMEL
jgi:hypothetical protein